MRKDLVLCAHEVLFKFQSNLTSLRMMNTLKYSKNNDFLGYFLLLFLSRDNTVFHDFRVFRFVLNFL